MFGKLILSLAISALLAGSAFAEETPAARLLQRIAALEGEWAGTYEWSGARSGEGELRVVYQVTGAGSAVIETMIQGGRPTMSTVYHLDGADLRMTHYCATRRQSRLRAAPNAIMNNSATFGFVDVTNADPARPGYVTGFDITMLDDNHIVNRFVFEGGAPRSLETITLQRVGDAAHSASEVGEHQH